MGSRKTLILVAAIGVGVFAGIALLNYVRGIERDVYQEAQPVEVLIATADIPAGATVAEAFESIETTEVPLKIRPSTFIAPDATDRVAGLVAQADIPRNQIIVSGLFVDPNVVSASLRDQIPDGLVAVAMEIDSDRAVGGYLQPGDRVNMMVNHEESVLCEVGEEDPDQAAADELAAEFAEANANTGFGVGADEVYCTFTQPARYLYQAVEILAVGSRQALVTGEETNAGLTPQGGTIVFIVPNEAAQLLASVAPDDVYLTMVPDSYEVEPLPALGIDSLDHMPAEISGCATPYGPEGLIAGDSSVVGDGLDPDSQFVQGHCVPLQDDEGE